MKKIGEDGLYGMELVLDLENCDPDAIGSKEHILNFARDICAHIKMKPFGAPFVERFGLGKDFTAGYSLVQLIETSSITAHFSEVWNRAHVNIFSCRAFDSRIAARFAKHYFGAARMKYRTLLRTGLLPLEKSAHAAEVKEEKILLSPLPLYVRAMAKSAR